VIDFASLAVRGSNERHDWKIIGIKAFVCLAGLLILWPHDATLFPSGMSDYTPLAAGARLVGSSGLYSPAANLTMQRKLTGEEDAARLLTTRLPWVAVVWRPLNLLSYTSGAHLFTVLMLVCLLGFVWTRQPSERALAAMSVCWSVPAVSAITIGQDVPLLLLLVSAGQRVICSYPFLAGALFALGSMKWHLIVCVPVVLMVRREWSALRGFLATGVLLLAVCFAVQGLSWPADYLRVVSRPEINRYATIMPNLTGILWKVPNRLYYEIPASVMVVALLIWSVRKRSSYEAIALALTASLLVSRHAYPQDALLILPIAVSLVASRQPERIVVGSILLLPITWMLAFWGRCLLVLGMIAALAEAALALRDHRAAGSRCSASPPS
jgi:hypothetical protein